MVNPQPTDAHLRIAHSIEEAIMARDFSKRQRAVLDLIIRLSWGCNKKFAFIPKMADFGIVGISKNHIRGEIDRLILLNVIRWDRERMIFWFNKHFDQWQLPPVTSFNESRLKTLLMINLGHGSQNGNFSSQNRDISSQNGNLDQEDGVPKTGALVPEKGISEFPKREPFGEANMHQISDCEVPKEKLKENIKDTTADNLHSTLNDTEGDSPEEQVTAVAAEDFESKVDIVEKKFLELTKRFMASPRDIQDMKTALNLLKGRTDILFDILEASVKSYKAKYTGDQIRAFKYFIPAIRETAAVLKAKQEDGYPELKPEDKEQSDALTQEILEALPPDLLTELGMGGVNDG